MGEVAFSAPRILREDDCVESFSSGNKRIDSWLHRRARGARRAGTAVVYASFVDGELAGFYSLSSQSVIREDAGGWIARNAPQQIPVILLGRLGVDERWQGYGLGGDLLVDAVHRSESVAEVIGARALIVDPVDERAREFYRHFGFQFIPGQARMYAKLH